MPAEKKRDVYRVGGNVKLTRYRLYFMHFPVGGTMTKKPAVVRFLLAVAAFALGGLRRLSKRFSGPGSGPFLAGC